MINLLPTDTKRALTYARQNTELRIWAVSLIIACTALIAVVIGGLFYLKSSANSYKSQVEQGQVSLNAQNQEAVKAEVQDLSSNLKLVDQVLSKQVLFSKLLQQIGATMPTDTILTGLSINELEGGIDLQAAARGYEDATQIQVNLSDPENKIFSSADIINIQCATIPAGTDPNLITTRYPCSVQIRALFSEDNPFLFINSEDSQ